MFVIRGSILFLLFLSFSWSASVEATVSTTSIFKGNTIKLTLKATTENSQDVEFPNIREIEGFTILGSHKNSNSKYTNNNGKVKQETTLSRVYLFMPDKNITIPSYSIKIDNQEYKTNPIKLTTQKSNAPKTDEPFSLFMKSSKKEVVVGESFFVTIYFALKNGVELASQPQFGEPTFNGFNVISDKQQNSYYKDGYHIQEIKYLLTAQKEGNLTINRAKIQVPLKRRGQRDFWSSFPFDKPIWKESYSNEVKIKVSPLKENVDLVGDFKIEAIVDNEKSTPNSPINLTITIKGFGDLEQFEFLDYDINGVTTHTNKAQKTKSIKNNKLYSTYKKSFAFIADNNFTIPTKEFLAYSLKNKKKYSLKSKSFFITIKNSKTKKENIIINKKEQKSSNRVIEESKYSKYMIYILVGTFILGVLFTLLFQALIKLSLNKKEKVDALKILYPHINSNPKIEEMVRKLYAKKAGDKSVKIDKKELKELIESIK